VTLEMLCELLAYELLLQSIQYQLRLLQSQPYILDPVARAFNCLDWHGER
jgi:hypothetical protein